MKWYIKKSIPNFYVDFEDEIDAEYWAGQIGETYEDFLSDKWILLSDEQVAFHEEYPSASIRNVLEMNVPTESVRTLQLAKIEKMALIDAYDSGDEVNSFIVVSNGNNINAWLTPIERSNYRSSIDAAELLGVENLSLYIGEMPITLPTATAKMLLAQIQLYADQCFIVTKQHEAAVEALDTIEAVDNYDITQGYPNKLTFNI